MSRFSEDAPETLEEWNAILANGCCCAMPSCPVPVRECESITKTICGYSFPPCEDISDEDKCRRFATRTDSYTRDDVINDILSNDERWDMTQLTNASTVRKLDENCVGYAESGSRSYVQINVVEKQVYNEETEEWEFQPYYTENYSTNSSFDPLNACSGTYSVTQDFVSEPDPDPIIDAEDTLAVCETLNYGADLTDCDWTRAGLVFTKTSATVPIVLGVEGTGTLTRRSEFSDEIDLLDELAGLVFPDDANGSSCEAAYDCDTITKTRFRWVIPDTWAGSYFKITWDVVFFPTTGDPSPVATDQTWEWSGPPTRKSGWYEINPPESAGEVRVVNVRFECYRSPYGNKPQVTGEAVDIPPP